MELSQLVIAVLNGHTVGGSFEIPTVAVFRIADHDVSWDAISHCMEVSKASQDTTSKQRWTLGLL